MRKAANCAVLAVAVALVAAAAWFGLEHIQSQPSHRFAVPAPEPLATQQAPSAQPAPAPAIRYPVAAENGAGPTGEAEVWNSVTGLIGEKTLEVLLIQRDFVQRVVATIDNLPRRKLPQRLMPVTPTGGKLAVIGQGNYAGLSPANYERYDRYVRLMQSVEARDLVAVYVRHYPLFQQAFEKLGYGDRYFNDRVVEAIDDVLATPNLPDPPALDQPKVLYLFEDPELEALSAGQKILIRIGPLNAAKVKAKLREIRKELVSQPGNNGS